jgi:hypothetical protein
MRSRPEVDQSGAILTFVQSRFSGTTGRGNDPEFRQENACYFAHYWAELLRDNWHIGARLLDIN